MNKIKQALGWKKIWISIDETSDIMGRKIAKHTIVRFFDDLINMISPEYIQKDDVLVFVSNASTYMVAAAKGIQILYPNVLHLHVTCLAHGWHRIAENIRAQFSNVDKFVSNGKNFFIKAASRTRLFEQHSNGISFPPQPVLTRWTTWLNAVIYHNKNK